MGRRAETTAALELDAALRAPADTTGAVTDFWGVPAHAYRRGRPQRAARRRADLLAELAHIRCCGCRCHVDLVSPHVGFVCECGPASYWAARLGVSREALIKAEQRAKRAAARTPSDGSPGRLVPAGGS